MTKARVSKAYRGGEHIGFKKTVGGREWFLVYGTSPADEARAISVAEVLDAKWKLSKASGRVELSQTDFEDAKLLIAGQARWASARQATVTAVSAAELIAAPRSRSLTASSSAENTPVPAVVSASTGRHWLYAAIDEFVATMKRSLKPDGSNGDHVFNTCERIMRAREAIEDTALDLIRRKELDEWLLAIRALPSKLTGKSLGAVTVRNIVSGVRAALTKFAEWEWWTPFPLADTRR